MPPSRPPAGASTPTQGRPAARHTQFRPTAPSKGAVVAPPAPKRHGGYARGRAYTPARLSGTKTTAGRDGFGQGDVSAIGVQRPAAAQPSVRGRPKGVPNHPPRGLPAAGQSK